MGQFRYSKTKSKSGEEVHTMFTEKDPNVINFNDVVNSFINLQSPKIQVMKGLILAFSGTYAWTPVFGEVTYNATNDKWEISRILGLFIDYE
jgi:hypothetical protein